MLNTWTSSIIFDDTTRNCNCLLFNFKLPKKRAKKLTTENIFLVGPMGSGKTTIGRTLAEILNLKFFDLDSEIEKRSGANIPGIFDVEGEQGFRDREAAVIDDLTQQQGIVLATGGGAILREENRRHLVERGTVIHLDSPIEKIIARTRRDSKRPLLQTGDAAKRRRELERLRGRRYAEIADHRVVTDNRAAGAVTRKSRKILERSGARHHKTRT